MMIDLSVKAIASASLIKFHYKSLTNPKTTILKKINLRPVTHSSRLLLTKNIQAETLKFPITKSTSPLPLELNILKPETQKNTMNR